MKVIKPSTGMYAEPLITSTLETECLYGENVIIVENNLKWAYCQLLTDNYRGWIKKEDLGHIKRPSYSQGYCKKNILIN